MTSEKKLIIIDETLRLMVEAARFECLRQLCKFERLLQSKDYILEISIVKFSALASPKIAAPTPPIRIFRNKRWVGVMFFEFYKLPMPLEIMAADKKLLELSKKFFDPKNNKSAVLFICRFKPAQCLNV